jgi:hypothetical protein
MTNQKLGNLDAVLVTSQVQRSVFVLTLVMNVGTVFDEKTSHVYTVFGSSYVQRRISFLIPCMDVGTALQQESRNVDIVLVSSSMQGRLSVFMPRRIDIGATIEEESHNICMIAVHRHVQRRLATVVVHIDFNATFQQHLHYWYATTLKGSCKELVHYGSIRPVYVGAAIQQESRDFVTAMVRSCVQYR